MIELFEPYVAHWQYFFGYISIGLYFCGDMSCMPIKNDGLQLYVILTNVKSDGWGAREAILY